MKLNENEMNFSVPLEIIKASEIEPKEVMTYNKLRKFNSKR